MLRKLRLENSALLSGLDDDERDHRAMALSGVEARLCAVLDAHRPAAEQADLAAAEVGTNLQVRSGVRWGQHV